MEIQMDDDMEGTIIQRIDPHTLKPQMGKVAAKKVVASGSGVQQQIMVIQSPDGTQRQVRIGSNTTVTPSSSTGGNVQLVKTSGGSYVQVRKSGGNAVVSAGGSGTKKVPLQQQSIKNYVVKGSSSSPQMIMVNAGATQKVAVAGTSKASPATVVKTVKTEATASKTIPKFVTAATGPVRVNIQPKVAAQQQIKYQTVPTGVQYIKAMHAPEKVITTTPKYVTKSTTNVVPQQRIVYQDNTSTYQLAKAGSGQGQSKIVTVVQAEPEVEEEFDYEEYVYEAEEEDVEELIEQQQPHHQVVQAGKQKYIMLEEDGDDTEIILETSEMTDNEIVEEMDTYVDIQHQQPGGAAAVEPELMEGLKKRPCNCNKSQCLKLYCECFANGEFCKDCNCKECYNTLEFEQERTAAVFLCLERNPDAFRPKIGKTGNAVDSLRHHKGCNCKRSGCLKNYCECFEAKIACSTNCKCFGCKNSDDNYETQGGGVGLANKRGNPLTGEGPMRGDDEEESGMKHPYNFMTPDVVDATVHCMMAQADDCHRTDLSYALTERLILEEFGRCLAEIIDFSIKNSEN